MQWPAEDSQYYVRLPEPGAAAAWTEGGFESGFSHREITPLIQKTQSFHIWGGDVYY